MFAFHLSYSLLARVSRFRGTNKQKGEMNAASWFTKPGRDVLSSLVVIYLENILDNVVCCIYTHCL